MPDSENMESDHTDPTLRPARPAPARPEEPAAPPTPVREAMDAPDVECEPVEQDVEERAVEANGEQWTVQVLGRSRGGSSSAPTDLLLLGFRSSSDHAVSLECLVVGRLLSGMTERQLLSALQCATPPLDPDRPRTLFPGTAERRRGRN